MRNSLKVTTCTQSYLDPHRLYRTHTSPLDKSTTWASPHKAERCARVQLKSQSCFRSLIPFRGALALDEWCLIVHSRGFARPVRLHQMLPAEPALNVVNIATHCLEIVLIVGFMFIWLLVGSVFTAFGPARSYLGDPWAILARQIKSNVFCCSISCYLGEESYTCAWNL